MARQSTARSKRGSASTASTATRTTTTKVASPKLSALAGAAPVTGLDPVIHERMRLAIISALAVNDSLTFNDLKAFVRATDGNLSVHARKLEQAGYVGCRKFFAGRMPRTEFKLTAAGRRALEKYLSHMESLIGAMRAK